jgi:hypothetical protein
MEAPRIKQFLDGAPSLSKIMTYTIFLVFFMQLIHEVASNIPYDLLCVVWIASVSLACILIGQWDTLSRKSFGPLAEIIGQENAMLIVFLISVFFIFLLPFVVLYKWLLV